MVINELDNYLVNYAKSDKTKRSILLVAPWGHGKTYYVRNNLANKLMENGINYVYVSLYGVESINELNKRIYLEIRGKKILKKSEFKSASVLVGKTIVNGVASFFGVNVNIKDRDLNQLYKSINLKNYLLIFDDLERCSINVVEILGYINNLVEHDGARALLVANESEILSTDRKERYLRIKEKTIDDTIFFNCDFLGAIKNITRDFSGNSIFKKILETKDEYISDLDTNEKILNVMQVMNTYNLRSVISACQKTANIFALIKDEYSTNFLRSLLLGNVAYYLKNNQNRNLTWGNNPSLSSSDLGCLVYPMFYPSFLFIKLHKFDETIFKIMNETFETARNQEIANEDIKIVYDWPSQSEKNVRSALDSIKRNLLDVKLIPVTEYLRLYNYIVSLKSVLSSNYSTKEYAKIMLKNVKDELHLGKKCDIYLYSGIQLEKEDEITEFNAFKTTLNELQKKCDIEKLNKKIVDVDSFIGFVKENKDHYITNGGFACKLDIPSFIILLKKSSSADIAKIRRSFASVYSFSNLKEFYSNDAENLTELLNGAKKLIDFTGYDKIQKLQINWFINEIEHYLGLLGVK